MAPLIFLLAGACLLGAAWLALSRMDDRTTAMARSVLEGQAAALSRPRLMWLQMRLQIAHRRVRNAAGPEPGHADLERLQLLHDAQDVVSREVRGRRAL